MKKLVLGLTLFTSLSSFADTCNIEISNSLQIGADGSQGAYQVSKEAQEYNKQEMLMALESTLDKVECKELEGNYTVIEISMFCIQDNYPGVAEVDSGEGCVAAHGQVRMLSESGEELVIGRADDSFWSVALNEFALPKRAYKNALNELKNY